MCEWSNRGMYVEVLQQFEVGPSYSSRNYETLNAAESGDVSILVGISVKTRSVPPLINTVKYRQNLNLPVLPTPPWPIIITRSGRCFPNPIQDDFGDVAIIII